MRRAVKRLFQSSLRKHPGRHQENTVVSAVRKPITPKPAREREKVLVILEEQCKQCGLCIEFCPKNVLCFDMSKYNRKGYHPVTACDIDACVNCEFCERICPDMAIFLAKKEDARKAYDSGAVEENTSIPEFERDTKEEK
jgi:2-oxoglutarate ferredoxin oxidoreductase subunit delta